MATIRLLYPYEPSSASRNPCGSFVMIKEVASSEKVHTATKTWNFDWEVLPSSSPSQGMFERWSPASFVSWIHTLFGQLHSSYLSIRLVTFFSLIPAVYPTQQGTI